MSAPMTTSTSEDTVPSERAGGRRPLPWIVALVALAVAVFAVVQWRSVAAELGPLRAGEEARAEVEAAAGTFLLELTTWDASDGLGDTRDRLAELGTGDFLAEVDRLFGAELAAGLRDVEATSQGEVQDLFVQRIEDGRAVVFGVVLQTQDTSQTEPDTIVRSARVVLEDDDGTWKVSRVEMVDEGTGGLGAVTPGTEEQP